MTRVTRAGGGESRMGWRRKITKERILLFKWIRYSSIAFFVRPEGVKFSRYPVLESHNPQNLNPSLTGLFFILQVSADLPLKRCIISSRETVLEKRDTCRYKRDDSGERSTILNDAFLTWSMRGITFLNQYSVNCGGSPTGRHLIASAPVRR